MEKRYTIVINGAVESWLDDLNKLLKTTNYIKANQPWSHWRRVMQNGKLLLCIDDEEERIVGMTTVIPIYLPGGKFLFMDKIIISPKCPDGDSIRIALHSERWKIRNAGDFQFLEIA